MAADVIAALPRPSGISFSKIKPLLCLADIVRDLKFESLALTFLSGLAAPRYGNKKGPGFYVRRPHHPCVDGILKKVHGKMTVVPI